MNLGQVQLQSLADRTLLGRFRVATYSMGPFPPNLTRNDILPLRKEGSSFIFHHILERVALLR